jgi:hypothetical protein
MFASARQIDGTDGWRWRLKQVKDILFGRKKGDYDFGDPPMTSYGNGVSHRDSVGRRLDIELRNPMAHYLDDALSPYPFPKSTHRPSTKSKPFPSTKNRFGSRSSEKHRTIDSSPTREYRSPSRKYRSNNRSPTRGYFSDDHSPTRGHYRSDDHSPTRGYYRSDDPSPTIVNRSGRRSPTRRHGSNNRPPTREYPSIASPSTSHPPRHGWDDRMDNSLSRYPRKDGKSMASLHILSSPPPSYPSQSENGGASPAVLRQRS